MPPPKQKSVAQRVGDGINVAKLTFKVAEHLGYVEVIHKRRDESGQEFAERLHTINLNDDERSHLSLGGTIVLVHGCGTTLHVTVPRFRN